MWSVLKLKAFQWCSEPYFQLELKTLAGFKLSLPKAHIDSHNKSSCVMLRRLLLLLEIPLLTPTWKITRESRETELGPKYSGRSTIPVLIDNQEQHKIQQWSLKKSWNEIRVVGRSSLRKHPFLHSCDLCKAEGSRKWRGCDQLWCRINRKIFVPATPKERSDGGNEVNHFHQQNEAEQSGNNHDPTTSTKRTQGAASTAHEDVMNVTELLEDGKLQDETASEKWYETATKTFTPKRINPPSENSNSPMTKTNQ